jgi:nitric oxide reductase large subunit
MQHKRLWAALTIVVAASFAVLGGVGYDALQKAPPIPGRVIVENGNLLFDRDTIQRAALSSGALSASSCCWRVSAEWFGTWV